MKVGIDKIGLYVPKHYLEMTELATARQVEPAKYTVGIGQNKMAVPTLEQDVVSMGANAAAMILDDNDRQLIDQVIFATESAFDYSKSGATFIHELLGIQPYCKAYEIKQACYGATAGLQLACDYVRLRPERRVLVIASDIARYGLNTGGEPTQGAGSVAFIVGANPRILAIDSQSVSYTTNQFDFWRPSYSDVAFVDGKFSTTLYQDCFVEVMKRYQQLDPSRLNTIEAIVCHLPFTKMGKKALDALAPEQVVSDDTMARWQAHYADSTAFGREVGNIYTGSLYLSLLSLLVNDATLQAGQTLGLFSYGSGAVAELLVGELQAEYRQALQANQILAHLERREALNVAEYERIFNQKLDFEQTAYQVEDYSKESVYRLEQVSQHRRQYGKS